MNCPRSTSPGSKQQRKTTAPGYRAFRRSTCHRTCNELTGTPINFPEYPTDLVLLAELWRLRYKLNLRFLSEMFLERGFGFPLETVRE